MMTIFIACFKTFMTILITCVKISMTIIFDDICDHFNDFITIMLTLKLQFTVFVLGRLMMTILITCVKNFMKILITCVTILMTYDDNFDHMR